jgi:eukaryotic-like serine/threonine-protein kinase
VRNGFLSDFINQVPSPVVANNLVYIASIDGSLYAFDAATHKTIVWEKHINSNIKASPVIASGFLYIGVANGNFYAFDALTGDFKWVYPQDNSSNS